MRPGLTRIYIDVMDGHFVPNISFGTPIMQSIRGMQQRSPSTFTS